MATELGVSQLSTTADVTVNLLDINNNKPQFSPKPTYEINIQENQEAGVLIGKVSQQLSIFRLIHSTYPFSIRVHPLMMSPIF